LENEHSSAAVGEKIYVKNLQTSEESRSYC